MFEVQIPRISRGRVLPVVALVLLGLLEWPLLAQPGSKNQQAIVQQVVVRETGGKIVVQIQSSSPVAPDTQVVTGPDRIVVDFPGATPSPILHALKVNQGALKGVRSGLFFSNPPITRVVLDLTGPQEYRIASAGNSTVVTLASDAQPAVDISSPHVQLKDAALKTNSLATSPSVEASVSVVRSSLPRLSNASLGKSALITNGAPQPAQPQEATPLEPVVPPVPPVSVTYQNGLLTIHADKATLSQVLYEVHLRTQADIAIPAGAEQEKVIAELGPGPARDVLAELLNGSAYNFIFVGEELALERVILMRRDGNF